MKAVFTFIFTLCISTISPVFAQYYYKDLLSNKQTIEERMRLKNQKVKLVKVHSLEPDGTESSNFFCEKRINKDYSKIETFTKSNISTPSLLTTFFNEKGLLVKTIDSAKIATSTTLYTYDNNDNLISILLRSRSYDDDFATTQEEERRYYYNEKAQPIKLVRFKNKKDSIEIKFNLDENGNVIDEIEVNDPSNHYYFYYDTENQLTDIVRYRTSKRKLVPDFMFEYNEGKQVSQMITTEEGPNTSDYFVWKYFYNDAGLRIIEKCYSKERDLMGSFEYEYE